MKAIKDLVNISGWVGKTCLLYSYAYKNFSDGFVPLIFNSYTHTFIIDDSEHYNGNVGLWLKLTLVITFLNQDSPFRQIRCQSQQK